MQYFNHKRLSAGVLVLNAQAELLLCHVTGQNHWDLPKGGIEIGEGPLEAAVRETREETGLRLPAEALLDLGQFRYTSKKNLHLFATCTPRFELQLLRCESHYVDRHSGRSLPEMDGFGWFSFERVQQLCTPKMSALLQQGLDLTELLRRVTEPSRETVAPMTSLMAAA